MPVEPIPCEGEGVPEDVEVVNGAGADAVNIQDGGNSITTDSLAQHVEDTPHVSGDVGLLALAVRNSAEANLTTTDLDYSPIGVDVTGKVQISAQKTEDAAHATNAVGAFVLAVRNDGGTTAFSDTNGDYTPVGTTAQGGVLIAHQRLASVALSNVSDSATSVTLSAATNLRRAWYVFNDSSANLFIKFGATASLTSFTVKVGPGQFYEMPLPVYTGVIDGIWDADSTGAARITEGTT